MLFEVSWCVMLCSTGLTLEFSTALFLCVRSLNVRLDVKILSELLSRVIALMLALHGIFHGVPTKRLHYRAASQRRGLLQIAGGDGGGDDVSVCGDLSRSFSPKNQSSGGSRMGEWRDSSTQALGSSFRLWLSRLGRKPFFI